MLVSFRGHVLVCVRFLVYGCKHQAWSRFLCKTKFELRGSPSEKPGEKPGENLGKNLRKPGVRPGEKPREKPGEKLGDPR